jgi:hypothetical protein
MKNRILDIFIVALLVALIMIILVRSQETRFKHDATRGAKATLDQSNLITQTALTTLSGNHLMLDLSENNPAPEVKGSTVLKLSAQDILMKKNIKKLRQYDGNIILIAENPAVSARIWMLLSQLGIKNLYILASDG